MIFVRYDRYCDSGLHRGQYRQSTHRRWLDTTAIVTADYTFLTLGFATNTALDTTAIVTARRQPDFAQPKKGKEWVSCAHIDNGTFSVANWFYFLQYFLRSFLNDLWAQLHSKKHLTNAWDLVKKNDGAAGGDRVSILEFDHLAEIEIAALSAEISGSCYRMRPCRIVKIPKRKGGLRTLTIPSIRDRVVHKALEQLLTPILEPTFETCSFAYRKGRSVQQAVARISHLRSRGFEHVLEADIVNYFNNVRHDHLMGKLEQTLSQATDNLKFLSFLQSVLNDHAKALDLNEKGLLQGSPLSPLLANLYLDSLDEAFDKDGIKIIRFADDFVILCKSLIRAKKALKLAQEILSKHGLELHGEGTKIVSFDRGFDFLGYLFVRSMVVKKQKHRVQKRPAYKKAEPKVIAAPKIEVPKAPIENTEHEILGTNELQNSDKNIRYDRGGRVLYLIEKDRTLDLRNHSYTITIGAEKEIAAISAQRVRRVEIGPHAKIEWAALDHAIKNNIDIAFVSSDGEIKAQLLRHDYQACQTHLAQALVAHDPQKALTFARLIVDARIRNQRSQLMRLNRRQKKENIKIALKKLQMLDRKVSGQNSIDKLRGIEGAAGAVYWPAFASLVLDIPTGFKRTRPATDALNATINYLCALLANDIRSSLVRAHLHLGFGTLHSTRNYAEAAVYDHMEAFRAPLTEGLAAFLFNSKRLRPEMFEVEKEVRIMSEGIRAIIRGYNQAVAKRISTPDGKKKLAWRPLMEHHAFNFSKSILADQPSLFQPFIMEAKS